MDSFLRGTMTVILTLAVIGAVGVCGKWQWNECRGANHGVLYCALEMGR